MIVVTGGAGFIGSNLVAALSERGARDVVVCDWLGDGAKWRNIAKHAVADIVAPGDLVDFLAARGAGGVEAVFHMGANSSTTETDVDLILEQNYGFSMELWDQCATMGIRLIYASSAATYGDGGAGFDDDSAAEALARLRPLNPYGWSKHLFDQQVARFTESEGPAPPQWVGLKFFNVYGPNEYHKGAMQSVVAHKFPLARDGRPVTLFKSAHPDYADGGQMRDFIYVRDCVDVMLWLYDQPQINGLFNLGTGRARSFDDLAAVLFAALDRPVAIDYIDMPDAVRDHYQYRTQAEMGRLRAAGYAAPFTSLEDGVGDYARRYLSAADPYR